MRVQKWLVLVLLLIAAGALLAQDTQVNFSGNWILNREKSVFGAPPGGGPPGGGPPGGGPPGGGRGGRGPGGSSKMNVTQKDNALTVETFRMNRDGEEVSTVTNYTLDGKECDNSSEWRTQISTANWSEDKKTLIIKTESTMERDGEAFTMESEEKWSLDKDVLTIESKRETPMGEMTSKAVYDRSK